MATSGTGSVPLDTKDGIDIAQIRVTREAGVQLTAAVFNPSLLLKHSPSKPPLLLICGWTMVKEDFGEWPEFLAVDRAVITYDNRGVGASSVPDGPYTIKLMAEDALAVLDALKVEKADVAGASMGGCISQLLALKHSARVRYLVLLCTTHGGEGASVGSPLKEMADLYAAGKAPKNVAELQALLLKHFQYQTSQQWAQANPDKLQALVTQFAQYRRSVKGILNQLAGLQRFNVSNSIGKIKTRVLVMHGTEDVILPMENAESIAKKIANSQLELLDGCGHMFWVQAGKKAAKKVLRFLNDQDRPAKQSKAKL